MIYLQSSSIRVANENVLDVTLMRTPLEIKLGNTYSWPYRGEASDLVMKYKFSVAYAVNLRMVKARFAGILGLSPARYALT